MKNSDSQYDTTLSWIQKIFQIWCLDPFWSSRKPNLTKYIN